MNNPPPIDFKKHFCMISEANPLVNGDFGSLMGSQ